MTVDFAPFAPFARVAKATLRPAYQGLRGVPVHAALLRAGQSSAQNAVFLPAYGPKGAALLRIYKIAEALKPLGWQSLVLPPTLTLAQRRRFLSRAAPDVVVMQGVRHALNRPALYRDWPVVLDMDDADFHLPHLADPVRRAMPEVRAVIAGSRYIAKWCDGAGAGASHVVWTGTPVSKRPRTDPKVRPPVVAWAQTRPMTYKAEAALVARVMRQVAARHPGVTLRLYDRQPGDDPGFAASFAARGLSVEWRGAMSYEAYLADFDDVALGLAPLCHSAPFARGKSFGKVLAYLDRKVPVVASDAGEHGAFFDRTTGRLCTSDNGWVDAITALLADPGQRRTEAEAAFMAFRQRLTVSEAGRKVADVLSLYAGDGAGRRRRA